jgi:hypothetical protein
MNLLLPPRIRFHRIISGFVVSSMQLRILIAFVIAHRTCAGFLSVNASRREVTSGNFNESHYFVLIV